MEYKLVIVVREDLEISTGKVAVQVAHASVECAIKTFLTRKDLFQKWYDEGQKKVVLRVPSLKDLFVLREKASGLGILSCLVQDAGLTEVPPGTVTVLGLGPDRENIIDKITGSLPLY